MNILFDWLRIKFPTHGYIIECFTISRKAPTFGLYPLNDETFCRKISWSLQAPRLAVITLGPRQLADILQTTYSNAFSLMKLFEFRLKFHWKWVKEVQVKNIGSDNGLARTYFMMYIFITQARWANIVVSHWTWQELCEYYCWNAYQIWEQS